MGKQCYEAMKTDSAAPVVNDIQDFKTGNGVGFWPGWISPTTGLRQDASHAFIHPLLLSQTNLHLLTSHKTSKVLFEGTIAVGVEYISNLLVGGNSAVAVRTMRARKEARRSQRRGAFHSGDFGADWGGEEGDFGEGGSGGGC